MDAQASTRSTFLHWVEIALNTAMAFGAVSFTTATLLHYLTGIEGLEIPVVAGLSVVLVAPLRRLAARHR